MKIPASIHVHGCEIHVLLVHNMYRDTGKFGDYDTYDQTIRIAADISPPKQGIAFFHEVIEYTKDMFLIEDKLFDHDCIQPIAISFYELINSKQIYNDD